MIWRRRCGHHLGYWLPAFSAGYPRVLVDDTAFLFLLLGIFLNYYQNSRRSIVFALLREIILGNLNLCNWRIIAWSFEKSICFNYEIFTKLYKYKAECEVAGVIIHYRARDDKDAVEALTKMAEYKRIQRKYKTNANDWIVCKE